MTGSSLLPVLALGLSACATTPRAPAAAAIVPVPVATDASGVQLPHWSKPLPPPSTGLHVTMGPDDLRVEGVVVAHLPPSELRAHGFDAADKASASDLTVRPLAALLEASDPTDAILAVDREIPYRMVTEVLFTLAQAGVSSFHFLAAYDTSAGLAVGSVDVRPPARGRDGYPVPSASAPIQVRLQPEGIVVRGSSKSVPAECGAETRLPYEFAPLARCGAALKKADGLSGDLLLLASPGVRFHLVVSAMDALAKDYPRANFGIIR